MPSSGLGNSHDAIYRTCQQKGYWALRRSLQLKGSGRAAPLLIGEAIHAYAETFIKAFMAGASNKEEVKEESLAAFNTIVGTPDPDTEPELLERDALARLVLPLWGERKWERLDSGLEVPVAVEWSCAMPLPAETPYGPIREELRAYTVKIDYVYSEGHHDWCVVSDHKGTGATSLESEARHYLMSDQHLGYAYVWSWANPKRQADKIAYDFTRLHKNITSPHTFHCEIRNVDLGFQGDDWYNRMLALRADMTRKWDMPREAWISSTAPHGPCMAYGRACEFTKLCKTPGEIEARVESAYEPRVE